MPRKILVFDDEPLILVTVEKALSKVGYLTFKAQDMKELREALKDGPFDMLITDVNVREDSLEDIIKKVKKNSPAVQVLKMSGLKLPDCPDHFIEKPFRIDELRTKVRDILNEPS